MRSPSFLTQFFERVESCTQPERSQNIVCLLQKDANQVCWLYLVDLDTRWRLCMVKLCGAQALWPNLVNIYTLKKQKHAAKSAQIKMTNRKSVTMKVTASSNLNTGI